MCLSLYLSDVVKVYGVLIIYVNGDDFDVVVFVMRLVVDYRVEF